MTPKPRTHKDELVEVLSGQLGGGLTVLEIARLMLAKGYVSYPTQPLGRLASVVSRVLHDNRGTFQQTKRVRLPAVWELRSETRQEEEETQEESHAADAPV